MEDEVRGRSGDAPGDDVQAQPDDARAWTEALVGRRVATVGDDAGEVASGWLPGAAIVVALAANHGIFRYFGGSYLEWYVTNGAILALALTIFSLAINLDDEPGLVAAHPADYLGAWGAFFGHGFYWLSTLVGTKPSESGSVPVWDDLVTMLFCLVWTAGVGAWLAVVVPAQYCVNLVCGAPVRLTLAIRREVIVEQFERATPPSGRTRMRTGAKRVNVGLGVRERPVTATAAISAAALFAASFAV